MLASRVIDTVMSQLSDGQEDRWTRAGMLVYLSSAQRVLALIFPAAVTAYRVIQLDEGAEQTVPADMGQFMGGVCNMGSDGSTVGRIVTNPDFETKNSYDPNWMSATAASVVRECVFDQNVPRVFFTSPPVTGTVYLKIKGAIEPADLANESTALTPSDRYEMPLVYITLALAYAENTEVGDKQIALGYMQAAYSLLGLKQQAYLPTPPRAKEQQG